MRPSQCHCAQMQRAEPVGGKGVVAGPESPESKIVPEAASWPRKPKSIAGGSVRVEAAGFCGDSADGGSL